MYAAGQFGSVSVARVRI